MFILSETLRLCFHTLLALVLLEHVFSREETVYRTPIDRVSMSELSMFIQWRVNRDREGIENHQHIKC
jgi:hypothetical protein